MRSIDRLKMVLEKSGTISVSTEANSPFMKRASATQYAPGEGGLKRSMMRIISEGVVLKGLRQAKEAGLILDFGKQKENPFEVYSYGFDFWYIDLDRNIHTVEVKSSFYEHGTPNVLWDQSDVKGFRPPSQFAEHVAIVKIDRRIDTWEASINTLIDNHHFPEVVAKGALGNCICCPAVDPKCVYHSLVERKIIVHI